MYAPHWPRAMATVRLVSTAVRFARTSSVTGIHASRATMRRAPPSTARAVSSFKSMVPTASAATPLSRQQRGFPLARRSVRVMATVAGDDEDEAGAYRSPPSDVAQFVERPQSPGISISPQRDKLLYTFRPPPYPFVSELARPELKLAGLRIDETQNSRSRMSGNTGMALGPMPTSEAEIGVYSHFTGIPSSATVNYVSWATNGKSIAFTVRFAGPDTPDDERAPPELWIADVDTMHCRPLLPGKGLNTLFESYSWLDDNTLAACVVPSDRAVRPARPPTPRGPRVQTNTGGVVAQARTYADLLKDSHDADLFEYFGSSEFVLVDVATGTVTPFGDGAPRTHTRCDPSPDGSFVIMEELLRPYSYEIPCGRFPKRVWITNRAGETVREVSNLPLADSIPIAHNSCRAGPRGVNWRPDKPAELYWTEAQDGGDPRKEASPRDITYVADMFDEKGPQVEGTKRFQTDLRYGGVSFGANGLGILYESWYKTRTIRAWVVDTLGTADRPQRLLYDRDYEDSYTEPGSPLSRRMPDGTYLLAQIEGPVPIDGWAPAKTPKTNDTNDKVKDATATPRLKPEPATLWRTGAILILEGDGASDTGDKPFLDLLNLDTGETLRVWECAGSGALERPGSVISDAHGSPITMESLKILLTRETPSENPQYFSLELGGSVSGAALRPRRISDFPHPHPSLVDPPKQILRYKRADGVDLNATLYTPPGYDVSRDGPLPTIMWAYPREFNSAEAAGQLRDSPNRFTGISPMSPLVWLARGYAVLDGPSLPIIGDAANGIEPNDTYVTQLVAGAKAAVEEATRLGVCNPARVAVGGHSYGAFMASNLLAHAPELFACAVARSGAYNRTLTPFGFQSEERTLWEAPETYTAMSPFMHANIIKKPILLIHGEEDTNSGTNVIQSERFFAALKGNGADARLVLLPHESHSTRGLESVLHVLAETSDFLDKHLRAPEGTAHASKL